MSQEEILEESRERAAFDHYWSEGLVSEMIAPLKSGKEATVWVCRGKPAAGAELLALKVYREHRSFRNDAAYRTGRVILNARTARAVARGSRFGREAAEGLWAAEEWSALERLHEAGAPVPRPVARTATSILMEFCGDADGAAPQLRQAHPPAADARAITERLLAAVETFLLHNVVHADLSAFNVLYDGERLWVIDFPQCVDPRFNPAADELLARDVGNLCAWATKHGAPVDAREVAEDLWTRFLFAAL